MSNEQRYIHTTLGALFVGLVHYALTRDVWDSIKWAMVYIVAMTSFILRGKR